MHTRKMEQPGSAPTYNQVAGDRSLDRIGALSDGLFAIAMTIIVLEIRVPDVQPHTDAALLGAIGQLGPRFLTYFLSFLTLGIFWNAQHAQLNYVARADRNLAWLQLVYLSIVALMPFSTSLLAEFLDLRVAFLVYWLNLYLLGVGLYVVWWYAIRANLLTPDAGPRRPTGVPPPDRRLPGGVRGRGDRGAARRDDPGDRVRPADAAQLGDRAAAAVGLAGLS